MKKNKSPLVTVSIPTYNSAKTLTLCLESVASQTYKNIEINIVDKNSTDTTLEIAKKYKCKIINYPKALLGARYQGVKEANGDYILMLDSDQVLEKTAVERSIEKIKSKNLDMLILEEHVYKTDTFIEKLFEMDRTLIHKVKDLSPYTGVVLPRFYRKSLLLDTFKNIPLKTQENVGGQDHAIIYYEAYKISKKVDILPKAVYHIEPSSLKVMWRKFYRWGYTSVDARYDKYDEMLSKKERFRTGLFSKGLFKESIGSILLLLIKGVPYKIGYYSAKVKSYGKKD